MARYAGKRVVITGGTSGIGLATAALLSSEGARVLVTGRSQGSLDAARVALGPGVVVERSDAVTDFDALADRASAEFGGVDLLVLYAGATLAVDVSTPPRRSTTRSSPLTPGLRSSRCRGSCR